MSKDANRLRQEFLHFWVHLVGWERQLVYWFAGVLLGRRAILPVLSFQAGGLAVIMWATPHPLIWMFAYILSFVYILLAFSLVRRWL